MTQSWCHVTLKDVEPLINFHPPVENLASLVCWTRPWRNGTTGGQKSSLEKKDSPCTEERNQEPVEPGPQIYATGHLSKGGGGGVSMRQDLANWYCHAHTHSYLYAIYEKNAPSLTWQTGRCQRQTFPFWCRLVSLVWLVDPEYPHMGSSSGPRGAAAGARIS